MNGEGDPGKRDQPNHSAPIARHHRRALSKEAIEKILELRKTYCLGPQRIAGTWSATTPSRCLVQASSGRSYAMARGASHATRAAELSIRTDMRRMSLGITFKQT